jgi:hypothetical protein
MKFHLKFLIAILWLLSLDVFGSVYNFKDLENKLGYPSHNFFGSTEQEILDLETYTSKDDAFYREINSFLRFFPKEYDWNGIGPKDAEGIVKNIDQVFTRVPELPADILLFRGVDLAYRKNLSFNIGDELIEKAYLSTSTTFKVAQYFAVGLNSDASHVNSKRAVFIYYSNKPHLKGILFDQGEDEIILKHGERIRVMALNSKNKRYEIYLAQICDDMCAKDISTSMQAFWKQTQLN